MRCPNETANYVPIILAMTVMAKNAPEYGLDHLTMEQPLEYDTVKLSATTNLGLVSDLTDTPMAELQQLNPALLRGTAPAGYNLRVPKGLAQQTDAALDKVPAEIRDVFACASGGIGRKTGGDRANSTMRRQTPLHRSTEFRAASLRKAISW